MSRIQKPKQTGISTGERYLFGFTITGRSGTNYKISFDAAPKAMYWTCACLGNRRWGQCQHLTDCGIKGRKFGHQKSIPTQADFNRAQLEARNNGL